MKKFLSCAVITLILAQNSFAQEQQDQETTPQSETVEVKAADITPPERENPKTPAEQTVNGAEPAVINQPELPSAEPPRESAMSRTKSKVRSEGSDKISIELKNTDIIEVLKILARKGNLNIVIGADVRGRVTLFLDNVNVWDALKIVFDTNNLAYVKEGNILKIISAKEYEQVYGRKFDEKRNIKIVPIKYADANDIANTLKLIKGVSGQITVDERTNSVVLQEIPEELERLTQAIKGLDANLRAHTYPLKFATPKSVEESVKKILTKKGSIHLDASTNKIIVTDIEQNLNRVDKLIDEIDRSPLTITKAFCLRYAKYDEVEARLKELLTKDLGTIKSDQRTNKIFITDLPENISKIEATIKEYDSKTPEVLIEAKIVEVSLSDKYKMGIDWEMLFQRLFREDLNFKLNPSSAFSTVTNEPSTSTVFFPWATDDPGGRIVGSGPISGPVSLNAVIEALKSVGDTKILSSPRITALNNQEAKLAVATRQAYVTDTVVQNQSAATTAQNVTFIDVGVILTITPTINKDDFITLKIKPEISKVSDYLQTSTKNKIPIVSTQELQTTVLCKDGITIIIGGLITDKIDNKNYSVPIMGDMPLIGNAFKKTSTEITKTELVIFLTPKIITGETNFLNASKKIGPGERMSYDQIWKNK